MERKVIILHLGLFGNKSHTDFEIARLINESREDIQKAKENGLKILKQKFIDIAFIDFLKETLHYFLGLLI